MTYMLARHEDERLCISLVTAGELACGPRLEERDPWDELVRRFDILEPDLEVAWRYGQTVRHLRDAGTLIGTSDLWIAATALVHDLPVVTRNTKDFRRVPGLDVRGY